MFQFQGMRVLSVPCGSVKFSLSRLPPLSRSHKGSMRGITQDAINPAILNVQYAVRGELAIKAEEYRERLQSGAHHDLPFNKVISSNIGNPQQRGLDQPPITFNRQVSLLVLFLFLAALYVLALCAAIRKLIIYFLVCVLWHRMCVGVNRSRL
jgi:Flp pilus assembly protein TadB